MSRSMLPVLDFTKWVSIWISLNPNIFLRDLEKDRIRQMLSDNPDFSLTVFYAKSQLNEKGLVDLADFLKEFSDGRLKICDFTDTLFEESLISDNERALYKIIQIEMKKLGGDEGNPAAISDILRLLSFCYSQGVYKDFDVYVRQKPGANLSAVAIEPNCFNCYIGTGIDFSLCNDFVAIPYTSTLPDDVPENLRVLQNRIIENYTRFDLTSFLKKHCLNMQNKSEGKNSQCTEINLEILLRIIYCSVIETYLNETEALIKKQTSDESPGALIFTLRKMARQYSGGSFWQQLYIFSIVSVSGPSIFLDIPSVLNLNDQSNVRELPIEIFDQLRFFVNRQKQVSFEVDAHIRKLYPFGNDMSWGITTSGINSSYGEAKRQIELLRDFIGSLNTENAAITLDSLVSKIFPVNESSGEIYSSSDSRNFVLYYLLKIAEIFPAESCAHFISEFLERVVFRDKVKNKELTFFEVYSYGELANFPSAVLNKIVSDRASSQRPEIHVLVALLVPKAQAQKVPVTFCCVSPIASFLIKALTDDDAYFKLKEWLNGKNPDDISFFPIKGSPFGNFKLVEKLNEVKFFSQERLEEIPSVLIEQFNQYHPTVYASRKVPVEILDPLFRFIKNCSNKSAIAKALMTRDEESNWTSMHAMIYFSPYTLPNLLEMVSLDKDIAEVLITFCNSPSTADSGETGYDFICNHASVPAELVSQLNDFLDKRNKHPKPQQTNKVYAFRLFASASESEKDDSYPFVKKTDAPVMTQQNLHNLGR